MEQFIGPHYYEMNVCKFKGVSFIMPEHEVDRSDLRVNAMIFIPADTTDNYTMQVWAVPKDSSTSFFCYGENSIPREVATGSEQDIVNYLNNNDEFLDKVKELADFLASKGL